MKTRCWVVARRREPCWSPDGEEIYFTRVEKSGDIFVTRESGRADRPQ